MSFPITIRAGSRVALSVSFAPSSTGSSAGTLALSAGVTTAIAVALTASAIATITPAHQVTLSWIPSASLVDGYFVYRSWQAGGPYSRVNSTPVPTPSYTDPNVTGGATYFYVVTAVASNVESGYSNETVATVPSP
jgi:hypothetical protein